MIPIITYTNSKCKDIWPIYIDHMEKYYGNYHHTIMVDYPCELPMRNISYFLYNQSDPFYDGWVRLLSNYPSKFFLYMQEDFIPYAPVNKSTLLLCLQLMNKTDSISCIRLSKSGINSNIPVEHSFNLHYVNYHTDYAFSMQPTIWRTKDFLKLQETKIQISPWDENKLNGNVLIKLDLVSLYHYNNEPKRGMAHYDSDVFPYIATALVKGKWNTKEYPMLATILDQYGINKTIRGEYE